MWEELIEAYADEMSFYACNYELMCKMLDLDYLQKRLKLLKAEEIYIYGGGYLGIQLYRSICQWIRVPAIVDKSGKLRLNISNIPVIKFDEFQNRYVGEKVVITSVRFYQKIRKDLLDFVPQEHIIYLGELLEGIL